jgi:uncharacterized protein (DUF302 family)
MSMNLALPCRVSVYEDRGRTKIGLISPKALLAHLSNSPALAKVASEVESAIMRMIDEAK